MEIVVIKPRDWSEIFQAVQALREQKIVVLNLTIFEPEQVERAVNFVTGSTYALHGQSQWIAERTFLFTPSVVQVST